MESDYNLGCAVYDLITLLEATLGNLARKQKSIVRLFPTFADRVKNVGLRGGVRLDSWDDDTWKFKVHSGTEMSLWYDNVLQFLNVEETLNALVANTRLWNKTRTKINLNKLGRAFMKKVQVKISCSCPAQKFYGGDYIISLPKYDAKYGEPENRPPRVRNPKKYGAYCKHLQAVMKVLPFHANQIAKWINQYHMDIIDAAEMDVRKAMTLKKEQQATARTARAAARREEKAAAKRPLESPVEEPAPEEE